ncbi:SCY1-like protein 2 [Ochlerotatus camptorhynchus]|uniref:SCY1-like protein 2 n=1 Tax=Ochlerotatus camptorhynchus TaxID=644619 RepID=UPI0031E46BF7
MEVFNKLYTSVTQTVSQLSSVLPGNPVTREYDITGHIASAGRGCMWKIYTGTKKSTGQEASIFLLEKRLLERYSKEDREEIFEIVRRGVTQITKIRHPQVLTVQHPLEESRESFAFATEPVYASLANVLGDTTNIPSSVISELGNYSLYETEIKYGLLQLIEGIQFIHNETKLVHRNISPHSVVLNSYGIWKIFGFDYCASNENANRYEYNPNLNILAIPSLEYTAPECVLESAYSSRADYYSLGVLICAIYAKKCNPFKTFGRDYTAFKKHAQELRSAKCPCLMNVPQAMRSNVEKLLTASPERRPDLVQLSKVPYFDDIGVKSLSYLDTLFQRDNQDKAKFYKGLPQIIKMLPARINLHRILTCLVKEFIHPTMIPFVLPNVLLIAESCTKTEYEKHIFPHIKSIMSLQDPVQILLIFMQNMELLLKLTLPNDVKLYVLPMVYKALESSSTQVQELCLAVLPSFANLIDYPSMKNSLLPRIKHLCSKSGVASVRVNCLLCVGQLLPQLDKWLVLDDILVFLPTVTPREPAVIMAIIGIYKVAANHEMLGIPKEFAANKVLPFLWPLSIEHGLTSQQYNVIMAFVTELSSKVQAEHMRKLEQLNTGGSDSSTLQYNILASSKTESLSSDDNPIDIITKDFVDKSKIEKPPSRPPTLSEMKPLENSTSKMNALGPINPSFSLPTPSAQFVPPSTFQKMPMWQQQRTNAHYNPTKAYMNGSQSFDHFQALLPPTNGNNFNNNIPSKTPLLQPMSTSRSNCTGSSQSSNILTKEDILEFLK